MPSNRGKQRKSKRYGGVPSRQNYVAKKKRKIPTYQSRTGQDEISEERARALGRKKKNRKKALVFGDERKGWLSSGGKEVHSSRVAAFLLN